MPVYPIRLSEDDLRALQRYPDANPKSVDREFIDLFAKAQLSGGDNAAPFIVTKIVDRSNYRKWGATIEDEVHILVAYPNVNYVQGLQYSMTAISQIARPREDMVWAPLNAEEWLALRDKAVVYQQFEDKPEKTYLSIDGVSVRNVVALWKPDYLVKMTFVRLGDGSEFSVETMMDYFKIVDIKTGEERDAQKQVKKGTYSRDDLYADDNLIPRGDS